MKDLCRTFGRIDLVIHGATDLIEKSAHDFSPDEFVDGMRSKALGMACVLAALSGVEVGTFINLSSVGGRWSSRGQSAYAAAHEVAAILISGTAGKRPGRWFNVYYGPWFDTGITRVGPLMERLKAKGHSFISEKAGSPFLIDEYEHGANCSVAFCGREMLCQPHLSRYRIGVAPPSTLLDAIEMAGEGVAEGRKLLDPARDRFVGDHFVNYEHPILPGVIMLEMMAQTASVLAEPGFAVTDVEDVIFSRAGTFPRGEPREFRTRARLVEEQANGSWFAGELFSLFTPPGGAEPHESIHAQCRMRFGEREPARKPSLLVVNTGIGTCRIDAKAVYETKSRQMRKGLYRNVRAFNSVSRHGVAGEVLATQVRDFGDRPSLGNPIRLDAIFDLVNPAAMLFYGNSPSFVRRFESIRFYRSDDSSEDSFCRISIQGPTQSDLIYDIEAVNGSGKVTERIKGVRKVTDGGEGAPELPEAIWDDLRENPRQREIRTLLGYSGRLVLAHVSKSLVEGALEAGEEELLKERLSPAEVGLYRSHSHPKRQLEWLSGRICAKEVVRWYLGAEAPVASAMSIQSEADNAPYVVLAGERADRSVPYVSISHSRDMVVAAAVQDPGIGIDVEAISESITEIADDFCTAQEVDRFLQCAGTDRATLLTGIWSVKEASRKVIGPYGCSMQELIVEKTTLHDGYIVCELHHRHTGPVRSITFSDDRYVYALSVLGRPLEGRGGGCESTPMVSEELTERICKLAASIVKVDDITAHTNLLDIGATSLQITRIAKLLEKKLGVRFRPEEIALGTLGQRREHRAFRERLKEMGVRLNRHSSAVGSWIKESMDEIVMPDSLLKVMTSWLVEADR